MSMTPEGKKKLSKTIRSLREHLLESLHDATEAEYRLSVRAQDAGLSESARTRRKRLERWLSEQVRAQEGVKGKARREMEDFRREAEKQAAYTLLNRLIILRLMEVASPAEGGRGSPLREPAVVAGGWESPGYQQFREIAPALIRADDTEGYQYLLNLVFQDLAKDLPGIFGPVGVADLIPVPPGTLRHVVEALNDPDLESCWTDDMTLGWVYQYWNDPEREALDAKLSARKKLEPHEIASKTQMFTERYLVDWLLQNSLGPMWFAMCRRHGWTPEVEADGTLDRLEERRTGWRAMRESGEVALTELMPLHTEAERRWAYYVPQPIPNDAVEQAPETVRDLRILDPAVGSGHFLVVAMDLLFALYQEEARHRGEVGRPEWEDQAIVDRILSDNLHGIDLDPRAIQIAAAALWMKGQHLAPGVEPSQLNLVASDLRLANLPHDDPALVEVRASVEREAGIPPELTDTVIEALRGADHLGSLLKIDNAVEEAIAKQEEALGVQFEDYQKDMFGQKAIQQARMDFDGAAAKRSILDEIEAFLSRHTAGDDLGLRLRGEQLSAGVRFVRMVREGTYDLVVANPPYQGTSKMEDAKYVAKTYPLAKADLYAAFLLRGLELAREGGVSAMLTMRNWMFIKQYAGLREHLLGEHGLRALGDFAVGAFEEVGGMVVSVCVSVFRRGGTGGESVAQELTLEGEQGNAGRTHRKRAATLSHEGRHTFDPGLLKVVPEWPLVYWWTSDFLERYRRSAKVGEVAPLRAGMQTANNARFLRRTWEVLSERLTLATVHERSPGLRTLAWAPYTVGAKGLGWIDSMNVVMNWACFGLEKQVLYDFKGSNGGGNGTPSIEFYLRPGVSYSMIGSGFIARVHRYRCLIGDKGAAAFPAEPFEFMCAVNRTEVRRILADLNPSVSFQTGDVRRAPYWGVNGWREIRSQLETAFTLHESHREPSVEFERPGPSPWRHAQDWAQAAVDRPEGTPLPEYVEHLDPEPPTDHLSFALGVAVGRFGPTDGDREGTLDPATADLSHALPYGLLFLDTTLAASDHRDSLGHPAANPLHEAWATHGPAIGTKRGLREWLSLDFFKDVHKGMYENRPIHWPLSSANRTFVAWVNIHLFNHRTLRVLLADHLHPALTRIEGELDDLRGARDSGDDRTTKEAEARFAELSKARDELNDFIAAVTQCADKGPPPTDAKCPPREQDARYAPDLDDGVMINSAALWPLLEPQWKLPRKWWKELAQAKGRKDYDWSKLAMRYWPTRVDEKCREDPSLAVAHGCFWRYHPDRAWAWELRLQDEIGPSFRIEEGPYKPGGRDLTDPGHEAHRSSWIEGSPTEALEAVEAEAVRRMGRGSDKQLVPEMEILEEGLWSVIPDEVWEMELKLSKKQDYEFLLKAPDEPAARQAYEEANPERVQERKELMDSLEPLPDLLEELDAYQEVTG